MNRKSKPERRSRKRAPSEAQQSASRANGGDDLRDKIAILVAAAIIIPIVVFTFLTFRGSDSDQEPPAPPVTDSTGGPRAAIVDHLALTQLNPAFAETAADLLEQAGYAVDYFPGEEVTVGFYRHLPTWGHELIILRVHSALGRVGDQPTDWVTLFTSESYDKTSYRKDQTARNTLA